MPARATMRTMFFKRIAVLSIVVFVGCAHRVRIESDPPGASIKLGQELIGVTPAEVTVKWVPFKRIPVKIDIPGRRSVVIDLAKDLSLMSLTWQGLTLQTGKLAGTTPRSTHRALFVRHHGPTGTWTPEDVK
jgi:hypothetical protein